MTAPSKCAKQTRCEDEGRKFLLLIIFYRFVLSFGLFDMTQLFRKQYVISPPKLDFGFFGSDAVVVADAVEMPPLPKTHHFLLEMSHLKQLICLKSLTHSKKNLFS